MPHNNTKDAPKLKVYNLVNHLKALWKTLEDEYVVGSEYHGDFPTCKLGSLIYCMWA